MAARQGSIQRAWETALSKHIITQPETKEGLDMLRLNSVKYLLALPQVLSAKAMKRSARDQEEWVVKFYVDVLVLVTEFIPSDTEMSSQMTADLISSLTMIVEE